MKCPKCAYIGFETTDRCRHCGYEFALLAGVASGPSDLPLRTRGEDSERPPAWLEDAVDGGLGGPSAGWRDGAADVMGAYQPEDLPLFHPATHEDDQPLITVAPPPRSPLAVRRTPVPARARVSPRAASSQSPLEPLLEFARHSQAERSLEREAQGDAVAAGSGPRARGRVLAALLDAAILLAIDAIVVYLTLRMASVPPREWRQLPPAPVLAFLVMVKLAYYSFFTAYGGQTIGKMAAGIRVVSDVDSLVGPQRALGRSLLWGASVAALGVPLLPWLLGRDGRAWHDRLTKTRVVPQ